MNEIVNFVGSISLTMAFVILPISVIIYNAIQLFTNDNFLKQEVQAPLLWKICLYLFFGSFCLLWLTIIYKDFLAGKNITTTGSFAGFLGIILFAALLRTFLLNYRKQFLKRAYIGSIAVYFIVILFAFIWYKQLITANNLPAIAYLIFFATGIAMALCWVNFSIASNPDKLYSIDSSDSRQKFDARETENIIQHIKEGQINVALDMAYDFFDAKGKRESIKQVIQLKSRYSRLKDDRVKGIKEESQYELGMNQIIDNLISILQ